MPIIPVFPKERQVSTVSTILPISREEAQSLLRLIPHLDRLTAEPDGLFFQAAEFRALQAMFHDVLLVLDSGQKRQLLTQWRGEALAVTPAYLLPSDGVTPDDMERDAGNAVLQAAVALLERDLRQSE